MAIPEGKAHPANNRHTVRGQGQEPWKISALAGGMECELFAQWFLFLIFASLACWPLYKYKVCYSSLCCHNQISEATDLWKEKAHLDHNFGGSSLSGLVGLGLWWGHGWHWGGQCQSKWSHLKPETERDRETRVLGSILGSPEWPEDPTGILAPASASILGPRPLRMDLWGHSTSKT